LTTVPKRNAPGALVEGAGAAGAAACDWAGAVAFAEEAAVSSALWTTTAVRRAVRRLTPSLLLRRSAREYKRAKHWN